MKTVKIILGIIIIISVIFLATGLFVKETKYNTKIEINKSLEMVFSEFNNESKLKKWIPELISLTPIDVKEGKVGSSYLMIVNAGNQKIKIKKKILEYVKNKKIVYTFDTEDLFKIDEYIFYEKKQITTIKKITTHRNKSYLMSCVYPYFKGKLQNIEQQYLNQFKKILE